MSAYSNEKSFQITEESTIETHKIDPDHFVINTLNRIMASHSAKAEKIKLLQKQKYKETLSQLTEKPTINPKSKEIVITNQCSSNISPLFIRTQIEITEKKKTLVELQKKKSEEIEKELLEKCTFAPNPKKKVTRHHASLVKDCLKWRKMKEKNIAVGQAEQVKCELLSITQKPTISKNSSKIASKVISS